MQVQSLGWEYPLEKGMANHSSILAWRIPWTEEPGGLQSTGLQSQQPWLKQLNTHAHKQREWAAGAQKTYIPKGFQEKILKGNIRGEGCRVFDQFLDISLIGWLGSNRMMFLEFYSSVFWFQRV